MKRSARWLADRSDAQVYLIALVVWILGCIVGLTILYGMHEFFHWFRGA